MQKLTTFLLFVGKQHGKAEEAINFYVSLFRNSTIHKVERYGPNEGEKEGTVKHAEFVFNGQEFMVMESGLDHKVTFTPAMSIFVTCESEQEIDELFGRLSENGKVHMSLSQYQFREKFAWVDDRFGVSWQLNLPNNH